MVRKALRIQCASQVPLAAGVAALGVALTMLAFGIWEDLPVPSYLPALYLLLLYGFAVFVTAMILCGCIVRSAHRSLRGWRLNAAVLAGVVLSVGLACCASPLVATFPPYAGFACRLICPETLYYPRPYLATVCTAVGEGESGSPKVSSRFLKGEVMALVLVAILSTATCSSAAFSLLSEGLNGAAGCLFLSLLVIVALCVRYVLGCRKEMPVGRIVAAVAFRCLWLYFWFCFALMIVFL